MQKVKKNCKISVISRRSDGSSSAGVIVSIPLDRLPTSGSVNVSEATDHSRFFRVCHFMNRLLLLLAYMITVGLHNFFQFLAARACPWLSGNGVAGAFILTGTDIQPLEIDFF